MDPTSLQQIAAWCGGRLEASDPGVLITEVEKDTRTLSPGSLYFALRGENFDGNDFLAQASEKGAVAAVVDRLDVAPPHPGFALIRVPDGLAALQSLASHWRNELSLRVVALTGSSGKTSTKELIAGVLAQRFTVTKTEGNLNNHLGLPLSILKADSRHQMAVWEIGMNHPGEIAPLAALARPDFAVIVNIGVAHIEHMGSIESIAREKGSLLSALGPNGTAILNADDKFCSFCSGLTRARVLTAGLEAGEVRAEAIRQEAAGICFELHFGGDSCPASLQTHGVHMVRNALLAAAVGIEAGLSLEECAAGLSATRLVKGRLQLREIRGILFIDDTYNANPDSMEAALATLAGLPAEGRRIAALGRMGELGSYAAEGYRRTGLAAARHADLLITVGPEASACAQAAREAGLGEIFEASEYQGAASLLRSLARPGDLVLVKGSRAAGMERIINEIA